ncbi:DUF3012 domain-containing protein [Vibrio sp. M260118]|uniref:DUF3012 domain-containing protein n=1 Tax=Vibrio sp. M260118 TaxID=3020896 RepID=UPI002F422A1A
MKKTALIVLALVTLSGCQKEIGTQAWCDEMTETPKSKWTGQNAIDYAKYCVLLDAVGSESWCNELKEKPKGDWSANDAKNFAQYCVF